MNSSDCDINIVSDTNKSHNNIWDTPKRSFKNILKYVTPSHKKTVPLVRRQQAQRFIKNYNSIHIQDISLVKRLFH